MTLKEQLAHPTHAFSGAASFLSNFCPYKPSWRMEVDGISYPSNEHFYQAQKFTDPKKREQIANFSFKGLKNFVKSLGAIREDWDGVRDSVMLEGLRYKFSLPYFKNLLLETKDIELVETNWWGDTYWGVCRGKGENRLGKMLMQIRSEL